MTARWIDEVAPPPRLDPQAGRARLSAIEGFELALAGEPCRVLGLPSASVALPLQRWDGEADSSDHAVLDRCRGTTLDIGCGPGRMTAALMRRGLPALGVDLSRAAVRRSHQRGAPAVVSDIFGRVPGEGQWHCALLADGNIGIGGDPVSLLERVSAVLRTDGHAVVDLAPPRTPTRCYSLRLEVAGRRTSPFDWCFVAADRIGTMAAWAGMEAVEVGNHGDRWFAVLDNRRQD